jgi:O-antigen/teichoic acid export membrane protein
MLFSNRGPRNRGRIRLGNLEHRENGNSETSDMPQSTFLTRMSGHGIAVAQRIARDPRLVREAAWVIFGKVGEFALLFVSLKVMTTLMTQDQVGEYQLVQSILMLLGIGLLGPIQQAYQRYFHTAEERGERRSTGIVVLKWYGFATATVLALGVVLCVPISRIFDVAVPVSVLAAGVFVADRWRTIALEILEIQRRRRRFALQATGHLLLHVLLLWLLLTLSRRDTTIALAAQLAAGVVFGMVAVVPLVRMVLSAPIGGPSGIGETVRRFGLPYAVLLACQWLQLSVDRFVIDQVMDKASVGLYVAAYQVCGVPFMLLVNIGSWLVLPIAYQRARDVGDARQIWAADRVLLAAIAAYGLLGFLAVAATTLAGPSLIIRLTTSEYQIPLSTMMALSVARYLQCFSFVIQPIFAVHQKMTSSLAIRVVGAVLAIPICWIGVTYAGVFGAAAAVGVSSVVYLLLLVFGPGGCLWLVVGNRRAAHVS